MENQVRTSAGGWGSVPARSSLNTWTRVAAAGQGDRDLGGDRRRCRRRWRSRRRRCESRRSVKAGAPGGGRERPRAASRAITRRLNAPGPIRAGQRGPGVGALLGDAARARARRAGGRGARPSPRRASASLRGVARGEPIERARDAARVRVGGAGEVRAAGAAATAAVNVVDGAERSRGHARRASCADAAAGARTAPADPGQARVHSGRAGRRRRVDAQLRRAGGACARRDSGSARAGPPAAAAAPKCS